METLRCQCASCDSDLADFVNLWVQIGKGYCSPVIEADIVKLDAKGPQRDGESGTLVADWYSPSLTRLQVAHTSSR